MTETESVDPRSEEGLEILEHAFSEGGKVLDFKRKSDGELRVMDVTDHHEELEEFYANHD